MDELASDIYFMKEALKEAKKAYKKGEVPVGAVVVVDGKIISKAYNKKESINDPTAHAEILAIRKACKALDNWRLTEATLYITKEPCIMCCGAIINARLKRVVYGCDDPKGGGAVSLYSILQDARLNHQVEIKNGILEKECREILQKFFKELRNQ
ncbi:MAG: tRNA adenosine(34) deaminase TadA [Thermodesulfovibrio sp.]|uniref:tRNA adenosine(34) deaminase TadA n=1 Tax=unclassified Thermodesulfovibrio TaxID=2645936 RepID=UPI0008569668|nr:MULTISPECIES: tRNA adenosine(34) deaminase TadA [unclassified Thermodesulfovibrio]MDI6714437.1 tRNA adenosine(34) deaminase TadA [Thermodesulfovibrio sp.]ODA44861.1 tRNA-specific adenosine-34 deaminase [Thermodesulfovibrio sp. N1]